MCEQQPSSDASQSDSGGTGRTASGLLHRQVTRVVTRGTVVEESLLAPRAHNFLASLALDPGGGPLVGIAWIDVSTGYVATKLSSRAAMQGDLQLHPPAELVVPVDPAASDVQVGAAELPPPGSSPPSQPLGAAAQGGGKAGAEDGPLLGRLKHMAAAMSRVPPPQASNTDKWDDTPASGSAAKSSGWRGRDLRFDDAADDCAVAFLRADAFSAEAPALLAAVTAGGPTHALELMALGGLLTYASWTQRGTALQLQHPVSLSTPSLLSSAGPQQPQPTVTDNFAAPAAAETLPTLPAFLLIDPATRRALELTRPPNGRRRARGSLIHTLDLCRTAMGSRLLDRRLAMPLVDAELIGQRLDAVGVLASSPFLCEAVRARLGRIPDLDRSLQRVCVGRFSYKDLFALRDGLTEAMRLGALLLHGEEGDQQPEHGSEIDIAVHTGVAERATPSDSASDIAIIRQQALWDAARRDFDIKVPTGMDHPTPKEKASATSHILADCAALLTSPHSINDTNSASRVGRTDALLSAIAAAHTSLVGSLVQSTAMGDGPGEAASTDTTESAHPVSNPDTAGEAASATATVTQPGDGWFIRTGFSPELDAARALMSSATDLTRDLQARLQSITGIRTLRVRRGLDERLYVEAPARAATQLAPFLNAPAGGGSPLLQLERSLKSTSRYRCADVQVKR